MSTVESLWTKARNAHGQFGDRRTPSSGIAAVLTALWVNGSAYGSEIASCAGQDQGNTARWLAKLHLFGFVFPYDERPQIGHQGGGRPAVFWGLTKCGHELVGLLLDQREAA